jgi:neutral ceramidase
MTAIGMAILESFLVSSPTAYLMSAPEPPQPSDTGFRAGAAALNVDPPFGLPMCGVVRRDWTGAERIGALEATAIAFEAGGGRAVLCGVDTIAVQSPEIDALRARIAESTGAPPAGVLVNASHTHHAPPGSRYFSEALGAESPEPDAAALAYVDRLLESIHDVCVAACERLEPAAVRWGLGDADFAVNRRERDPDGMVRRLGWHEQGMLDRSVPVLQARRADGSVIGTLVAYGAHPVTTWIDSHAYSPDYPGVIRDTIRRATGGECVFFLGAAGNVMPRVSFERSGRAMREMGEGIAIEALHAVAGPEPVWPSELYVAEGFRSGNAVSAFRWRPVDGGPPPVAAAERRVRFPLVPLPSLDEVEALVRRSRAELDEARARGATEGELRGLRYHGLNYALRAHAELGGGAPRTEVEGTIGAVRIGDGVIATGPGEIFTEIGLAVKERSPADVTLYAGYTNGLLSYFPIASEYPLGGYEPGYGNKTYGLPSQVSPESDRILVQSAVELVRDLFPERAAADPGDWLATGALPSPPRRPLLRRPPED